MTSIRCILLAFAFGGPCLPIAGGVLLASAYAQEAERAFDIPAQPLSSALLEFSRQSDLSVAVSPDLVVNKSAPAVKGTLIPDVALQRLLAGTGLKAEQHPNGVITLALVSQRTGELQPRPASMEVASMEVAEASDAAASDGAGSQPTAGSDEKAAPEQIIVTARRVEERLQDVPISISVFNQAQLNDRNITSAADLATYTPSLTVNYSFGPDDATFAIRGFSESQATAPTVGVFFDDVVSPRAGFGQLNESGGDGAGPGSFFDLQNVEVLKGPQGTLFGLNTTGGDVLLVPQKPNDKFGGYVQAGYGNYDMEQTQAVVNVPINQKVALRVGFNQETRDGYIHNVSGIGPSRFDDIDYIAGRVGLLINLSDAWENYTVITFSRSDTNGPLTQMFACNPKAGGGLLGAFSCAQFARSNDNPGYDAESDLPNAKNYVRQWQVINTTTWETNDSVTVKNIASYAQYKSYLENDLFGIDFTVPAGPGAGTPVPEAYSNPPPDFNTADQLTFTEELRANGKALAGKLDWQGGVYLEGSDPLAQAGTETTPLLYCSNLAALQCDDYLGALFHRELGHTNENLGTVSFRDYAAYGQGTYAIRDNLKFTAGLRYTYDDVRAHDYRTEYYFPSPNTPVPACLLTSLTLSSGCLELLRTSSHAPTWLLDLDYYPVEDLLTYVKYARGYRQGGVTPSGVPGWLTYRPEKDDDYELGTKWTFRGVVSGFVNASGFYDRLTNQQLNAGFASTNPAIPPAVGIVNAGASRIYGVELESLLVPYKGLSFDVAYTYLNTKLTKVGNLAPLSGSPYNIIDASIVQGSQLYFSPHNKLDATVTYQLPLAERVGKVSIGLTDSYTSSQLSTAVGPYDIIPSFNVLNLNLNWEAVYGGPFDAEFFITNVANSFYAVNIADDSNTLGFASRFLGEPRMFGARLRYHF